jgi:hypothetical protein
MLGKNARYNASTHSPTLSQMMTWQVHVAIVLNVKVALTLNFKLTFPYSLVKICGNLHTQKKVR